VIKKRKKEKKRENKGLFIISLRIFPKHPKSLATIG
jgi:hypothetical protein